MERREHAGCAARPAGCAGECRESQKGSLGKLFLVYAHMPAFCAYRGRAGRMGQGWGRMRAIFAIISLRKHPDALGMRGNAHYRGGREPCQCLSPRLRPRHLSKGPCRPCRDENENKGMRAWQSSICPPLHFLLVAHFVKCWRRLHPR